MNTGTQKMQRIKIYARREITDDTVLIHKDPEAFKTGKFLDVCFYSDIKGNNFVGRIPWYYSSLPKSSDKTVMLNCYRYEIVWIPPE